MKKVLRIFLVLAVVALIIGITYDNAIAQKSDCDTVKGRTILYSSGHYLELVHPIKPGFDAFGYNYQAHLFNGYYTNSYLGKEGRPPYEGDDATYYLRLVEEGYFGTVQEADNFMNGMHVDVWGDLVYDIWHWPYRDVILNMKWSDTWISNKDCNSDGKLDRGYSCDPEDADNSACPGAWLTNHQQGTCVLPDGKENTWTYYVKIITPSEDAVSTAGVWHTADGAEIGPAIWGSFAVIQRVSNDACWDEHGLYDKSPAGPGFGKYN
jgi:hypothetical protein